MEQDIHLSADLLVTLLPVGSHRLLSRHSRRLRHRRLFVRFFVSFSFFFLYALNVCRKFFIFSPSAFAFCIAYFAALLFVSHVFVTSALTLYIMYV